MFVEIPKTALKKKYFNFTAWVGCLRFHLNIHICVLA